MTVAVREEDCVASWPKVGAEGTDDLSPEFSTCGVDCGTMCIAVGWGTATGVESITCPPPPPYSDFIRDPL